MNNNLFPGLIGFPLVSAAIVYLLGRIGGRPEIIRRSTLLALLLSWVPFVMMLQSYNEQGTISLTYGAIALRFDGLSLLLAAIVLALATLVTLFSAPVMSGELGEEKYYAMLLSMSASMIGLGCAADLFNLWLWFEAMAIASYLLVAFYREQPASLEAGVKYLVQSAAGSILVLIGIALVLWSTGTLDLAQIHIAAHVGDRFLLVAGVLFVIGFGVKVALVPLHTWLPDAHAQAPSGISAMLSGVVIEAGLIALLRALGGLAGVSTSWGMLLMLFGALNMFAGNLLALRQKQVKRLLAFSSISHVGYIVLGLGIGVYAGEVMGAQGGLFHLFNHGLMKGLAFLAAGAFLFTLHSATDDHAALTIDDLNGVAQRYPLAALTLSIALLSLAGIPPLAGFASKWQIFVAGFQTHDAVVVAFIAFAAFNSLLSMGYYLPLMHALYKRESSDAVLAGRDMPFTMVAPLMMMAIALVAIGVWPGLLQWLTGAAGQAVLAAFGG